MMKTVAAPMYELYGLHTSGGTKAFGNENDESHLKSFGIPMQRSRGSRGTVLLNITTDGVGDGQE